MNCLCPNSFVVLGHGGDIDYCPDCDTAYCHVCTHRLQKDSLSFSHPQSMTPWCPNYIALSQLTQSSTPAPVQGSLSLTDPYDCLTPPMGTVVPVYVCECGSRSIGIKDYAPGHSSWCGVYGGET